MPWTNYVSLDSFTTCTAVMKVKCLLPFYLAHCWGTHKCSHLCPSFKTYHPSSLVSNFVHLTLYFLSKRGPPKLYILQFPQSINLHLGTGTKVLSNQQLFFSLPHLNYSSWCPRDGEQCLLESQDCHLGPDPTIAILWGLAVRRDIAAVFTQSQAEVLKILWVESQCYFIWYVVSTQLKQFLLPSSYIEIQVCPVALAASNLSSASTFSLPYMILASSA